MQLKRLLQTDEDRAVSPVIGVILMVAITVILAAVIASFVLGLGQNQEVAPTSTFDFNYDADENNVTVTHTGGDNVRNDSVAIRGTSLTNNNRGWYDTSLSSQYRGTNSTEIDGKKAITSGDSAVVQVGGGDYVIRVVWESPTGGSSSELATDRGPDA